MILDMEKIQVVKEEAVSLLRENISDWEDAYAKYAVKVNSNLKIIEKNKEAYKEWAPLYLHSSLSGVMVHSKELLLRYKGQKVAAIKTIDGEVLLNNTEYAKANKKYFDYSETHENIDWRSAGAIKFRNYFKGLDNTYQPMSIESKYESLILTEMEKDEKKSKFQGTFSGIQPVKLADIARFQMKTPFGASGSNSLKYSGSGGGGIDILARVGNGTLSVFELKEPGIKNPHPPLEQGLAYTVFLRELLRSKSGDDWYKIFGYKRNLPKKLNLNCVVLMGSNANVINIENQFVSIDQDEIQLHYMYYKDSAEGIIVTDESLTS